MIPKYHYCMLPSGNQSEFHSIEVNLKRLKIGASYCSVGHGGRIYRIPSLKLNRLPKGEDRDWVKTPMLKVYDGSGHGVYPLSHVSISRWRSDFRASQWIKL